MNIHLTPTVYSRGVLMNLGGQLNVTRNMSSEYTRQFANKGAKIGDTFNVRKPQRYEGTENVVFTPEDTKNISTPITINKRFGIHLNWGAMEKTLSLERANELYFKPAAIRIAAKANADAARFAFLNSFNTVGVPGTVPGAGSTAVYDLLTGVYLAAGDLLVEQGLPENEKLSCIITRRMSSSFVGRVADLFIPAGTLESQYKKGYKDPSGLGYYWFRDQGLHAHTIGTLADADNNMAVSAAPTAGVDGNNATGSIILKNLTSGATIKAGDWFTIDTVYSVHPITKVSTGSLQQFKVLQDAEAAVDGTVTLSVFPSFTSTGQYQNIDSQPAADDAVLFCGAAATDTDAYAGLTVRAGLLLHKNAFACCFVPFELPEAGMGAKVFNETDPDTGAVMRFMQAVDAVNDQEITRIEILYGFGKLYAEMCCNIISSR